jgi:hypothetical protein
MGWSGRSSSRSFWCGRGSFARFFDGKIRFGVFGSELVEEFRGVEIRLRNPRIFVVRVDPSNEVFHFPALSSLVENLFNLTHFVFFFAF